MRLPTIRGVIDRRVLVNFRVDPAALTALLPAPFRPQLVQGYGIAGICLIRLKQVRPAFLPAFTGIASENAAHRIAVEWEKAGQIHSGVYVPRRDTSSWLNVLAGGRIFPGVHHRAKFDVQETATDIFVAMKSIDGSAQVLVKGHTNREMPSGSIFRSIKEASDFFKAGSLGYSPAARPGQYDGMELRTFDWEVEPLLVTGVESSYFEQRAVFPEGSVTFDNALLMRGIDHEWHGRESLCCAAE